MSWAPPGCGIYNAIISSNAEKCEDCDFVGQSRETMEVHIEDLETHLNTCEIYRCRRCYLKVTKISNIKTHVKRRHKGLQATLIDHQKISRNNENEVTSKEHWHSML